MREIQNCAGCRIKIVMYKRRRALKARRILILAAAIAFAVCVGYWIMS